MKTGRKTSRTAGLLALALLFAFAGVALAADSTTLLGYQIDFLGFTDNGDNTSTWTYAVTADGDEPQQALSHWTLGIDLCYEPIVAPADDSTYTTVTSEFGCGTTYNCQASTCTVVHGLDATTGVSGIKFEDCDPQLGNDPPLPRTHIFQFTVSAVPTQGGDVDVAVKPGTGTATGTITGPACGPNAIALDSFSAQPGPSSLLLLGVGALGLVAVGLYLRRR